MPNLNKLIFTAADYKIVISAGGIKAPLTIVESFDYSAKKEHEYIHIVGSEEPVGLKTNTSTYPGRLQIEAGELELFLIAIGVTMLTQVKDATIAIVTFGGDLVKVFKSCVFTSHDASVKAKDKRSLLTFTFESIGVAGI